MPGVKAKAGKPDAGKKPGGEGLPYSPAEPCVGGPIDGAPKGSGLGEGYGVKGGKSIPPVLKGKGGPSGAKGKGK